MKFKPIRRLWVSTVAVLLATTVGACLGYLAGRSAVATASEISLQQEAAPLASTIHSLVLESHYILAKANALKEPPCSEAEIAQLRLLLYHSINFRELGRIHDGTILCTTLFEREKLPKTQFVPAYRFADGSILFRDMAPYVMSGAPVYIRQRGDYFAVESPAISGRIFEMRKNHEVFSSGSVNLATGAPRNISKRLPGATIDRDARGRIGDTLFATYCTGSPGGQIDCATSFGSFSGYLHAQRNFVILHALRGGVLCGLTLTIILLLYWRRRSMPQQLMKAIREDKLYFVYQPIVDLSSGHVVAAETLARWIDDDGLQISPDIFVRLAEERGLSLELARLALRHSLHDFSELLCDAGRDFHIHVNLTASDLADPGLLPMLEHSLAAARVAPHKVVIELTESATARHSIAIEAVHQLRQRGHSVQIDDFGTGYSSLAYLKDLAVDAIKIDKAFTQTIGTDSITCVILPQILTMATGLGLLVVAEGIELPEQAAYFAGFDPPIMGQGWLFGKPQTAQQILHALDTSGNHETSLTVEHNA